MIKADIGHSTTLLTFALLLYVSSLLDCTAVASTASSVCGLVFAFSMFCPLPISFEGVCEVFAVGRLVCTGEDDCFADGLDAACLCVIFVSTCNFVSSCGFVNVFFVAAANPSENRLAVCSGERGMFELVAMPVAMVVGRLPFSVFACFVGFISPESVARSRFENRPACSRVNVSFAL